MHAEKKRPADSGNNASKIVMRFPQLLLRPLLELLLRQLPKLPPLLFWLTGANIQERNYSVKTGP